MFSRWFLATLQHCSARFTDYSAGYAFESLSTFVELPRKLKRSERKLWVTSVNELKRRARVEKKERILVKEATLCAPENGLLVKELVPVAHQVLSARTDLFYCASRVAEIIPINYCRVCGEVHVGRIPHMIRTCDVSGSRKDKEHTWERGGLEHILPVVESFHLYDRLGRAVSHNERLEVDRLPAIVELCIQAGVNMPEYPTRRRDFPIYRVAGRLIDFEKRFPKDETSLKDLNPFGFWKSLRNSRGAQKCPDLLSNDLKVLAVRGMNAWEVMCAGASKLMQKYAVQTCGYCPEVQVGPKGHRVRQCQAFKHQMRDGQHDWQEAAIEDLVPPIYVWHVQDHDTVILVDALKRYYGKLPAVVELFAQAGARVGENYKSVMRNDVVVPDLDEEKLVV